MGHTAKYISTRRPPQPAGTIAGIRKLESRNGQVLAADVRLVARKMTISR